MFFKKHRISCIVIIIILIMWMSGTIPSYCARIAAIHYVNTHYSNDNLTFKGVDFSGPHNVYLAYFKTQSGEQISFLVVPKMLPLTVFDTLVE